VKRRNRDSDENRYNKLQNGKLAVTTGAVSNLMMIFQKRGFEILFLRLTQYSYTSLWITTNLPNELELMGIAKHPVGTAVSPAPNMWWLNDVFFGQPPAQ